MTAHDVSRAQSLIRIVPDFPEPGVRFQDITPLLADARALRACTEAMLEPFAGTFDLVAGIEARGFLLAGAAAMVADVGLVPIRKAGKLPRPAASVTYELEYGSATVEAHDDVAGARVLLLDDVLATGGTLAAAHELVDTLGGTVIGSAVLLELSAFDGRSLVPDAHVLFSV